MIEKEISPTGRNTKVTFKLPANVANAKKSVAVAGTFNDWSVSKHPMKLDKDKKYWMKTIALKKGQHYEYRYSVDEADWITDREADGVVPNNFLSENSVVVV